jgi:hypothetical protein
MNFPFSLSSRHKKEVKKSVSASYWKLLDERIKDPKHQRALKKFIKLIK